MLRVWSDLLYRAPLVCSTNLEEDFEVEDLPTDSDSGSEIEERDQRELQVRTMPIWRRRPGRYRPTLNARLFGHADRGALLTGRAEPRRASAG